MKIFEMLFAKRPSERERIISRLEEIERESVWHSEPDWDQLLERLAEIDGSPFNGHYHYGRCVKEGTHPDAISGYRGALRDGGLEAGRAHRKLMGKHL